MPDQIINALNNGHRTMRHILALVQVQLDVLQPETHNDTHKDSLKFLDNAIDYLRKYPGLVHHPVEELIFERLIRYSPQASSLCTRLTEQHDSFKTQEVAIMGHLRGPRKNQAERCLLIKKLGLGYCADHTDHIDSEELDIFPQAINWLGVKDWDSVREKSVFDLDPLSDPTVLARYENIYDYLMASSENFTPH